MRVLLLFILFSLNNLTWANECSSQINLFLNLSDKLTQTTRPPKVREHLSYGHYLSAREVNNIITSQYGGAYIYVIDTEGRIMYAPRFHYIHDTGNVISTHTSLINRIKEVSPDGKPIAPIAMAGEFYITAERVSRFNNKSGRWRGNEQHLLVALEAFRKRGFIIEDSVVVNYVKLKRMVGLYDRLYKRYPLNETGEIDYKRVTADLSHFYDDNSLDFYTDLAQLVFLIVDSYKDAGGFLYTFFHLYETNTLDRVLATAAKLLAKTKP